MSTSDRGTVKIVEVMGESEESWEDAAQQAITDTGQTIDGISGIDIVSQTAEVENDEIVQYRTTVHLSFPVQR
ncbi:dodecin family protein [Halovenus marina]|uniref:dodecin family protein n=1 Tax=Halovenus marina TaxID=3396621 RepID=UPI003F57748A